MNQTELIFLLQKGDEAAFKKLVDDWQKLVYNTAVSVVQNENDADDITQDVFMQAYQSVSSFKGEAKISTWLYKITVNKSLDFLKRKSRKKRFGFIQSLTGGSKDEEIHPEEFNHPGVIAEQKEHAAALFNAMKKLPDKQRIAFTLHKMETLKHYEVAEIMELSVQAVESLIARAKAGLRKELEQYYHQNIA